MYLSSLSRAERQVSRSEHGIRRDVGQLKTPGQFIYSDEFDAPSFRPRLSCKASLSSYAGADDLTDLAIEIMLTQARKRIGADTIKVMEPEQKKYVDQLAELAEAVDSPVSTPTSKAEARQIDLQSDSASLV